MPQTQPFQGLSPLTRSDLLTRLLRQPDPYAPLMKAIKVDAYECLGCYTLYREEEEAAACCEPKEVDAFACGVCRKVWLYDYSAESCCASKPLPAATAKDAAKAAAVRRLDPREAECPVCEQSFGTSDGAWLDAASHCLGRDLSPAQTHQIAQMVRLRDVPWTDAIEAVTGAASKKGSEQ